LDLSTENSTGLIFRITGGPYPHDLHWLSALKLSMGQREEGEVQTQASRQNLVEWR
jgi:hypothetical protein